MSSLSGIAVLRLTLPFTGHTKQCTSLSCSCAVYLQDGVPQHMQDQLAQLDRLHWLLADTTRLVSAVGRVEGNAAAKATLQVCSLLSCQMLTSPTYAAVQIQFVPRCLLYGFYMWNNKLLKGPLVLVTGQTVRGLRAVHIRHLHCRVFSVAAVLRTGQHALQGAATVLQQHQDQVHASRVSLANHLAAAIAVTHGHHSRPFVTAAAHGALCNSVELIRRLAEEAQTADQQHGYSGTVPGWKQALLALQEAALQPSELEPAGEGTRPQEAAVIDSPDEARLGQQWQEEVEGVVKNMLLWAQNIHSLAAEVPPETGEGASLLCVLCCFHTRARSRTGLRVCNGRINTCYFGT